jgi:hypothetical protein
LQFEKEVSLRPSSTPAGAWRFEQLVPQQRWEELQLGVHMPGGLDESTPPPSPPPTQLAATQLPPPQLTPQAPQLFGSVSKLAHRNLAPEAQQV